MEKWWERGEKGKEKQLVRLTSAKEWVPSRFRSNSAWGCETKRKSPNGPYKQDYGPHDRNNSSIEFNVDRGISVRSHHLSLLFLGLTLKRRERFSATFFFFSLSLDQKLLSNFVLIELRNREFCSVLVLLLLHGCLFVPFLSFFLSFFFLIFRDIFLFWVCSSSSQTVTAGV